MKQNTSILLKNKNLALQSMKIQRVLLSIQTICRMFTKILKSTTQIKKCKVLIVFAGMIAGILVAKNSQWKKEN